MRRSDLWRWLVLALVAAFVAFSCSFLLAPKEAQAKDGKGGQAPAGGGDSSSSGGHDGGAKPAGDTLGGAVNKGADVATQINKGAQGAAKDAGDAIAAGNEGATNPAGDALGGATKAAGDAPAAGNKGAREQGHGGGTSEPIGAAREDTKEALEAPGSAPKANRLLPAVEAEPAAKDVDRTLGETTGTVKPVTEKVAEPTIEGTAGPLVGSVKGATETIDSTAKLADERLVEGAERTLSEVTGTVKPVTEKVAEPTIEGTAGPLVGSVKGATGPLVSPIRETATGAIEPVAELADEAVEPVLGSTTPVLEPVLGAAGSVTKPVLEGTASLVEPVLEGVAPVVGPVLNETGPVVDPVLEEAAAFVGPTNETIGLTVPLFDTPLSGAVEPTTTAPVFGPLVPAAPEPIFGDAGGALLTSPAGATLTGDAPAALPAISSPALGQVAEDTKANPSPLTLTSSVEEAVSLRSAGEYGSPSKTFPEFSGSPSRSLDGSLFGRLRAALLGSAANAVMKKGVQEDRAPLLPFGLPAGAPPVGSSFGGSGFGIGLDLLAALALLSVFLRVGSSSRVPRDLFKLVSSPRLVIELPG